MSVVWVGGALANRMGNGGGAWPRLSYVRGFQQLGFDVYFIEQIDPATCVDAAGLPSPVETSANLEYFRCVTERFDLSGRAALVDTSCERAHGIPYRELLDVAESVVLLVNISGHLKLPALLRRIRKKAYVDLDPGFTQFWHADGQLGDDLAAYDVHFTVGENIGTAACPIPTGGIRWRPTRQPVVLEDWPVSSAGDASRFTTIANWRGPFGPVSHGGKTYGLKVHQFRKYAEIPRHVDATFEIALNIHPGDGKDREMLDGCSWRLVDPRRVAPDPDAFRRYVQCSGAEFSAAQHIYTETRSGWFSDRSVRYLASGKPVLVEETGTIFSGNGEGVVTFSSLKEAVAGAKRILADYPAQARAAREIAEDHFEAGKVLTKLVDDAGV